MFENMTTQQLLERRKAIKAEAEGLNDNEKLAKLEEEVRAINDELEARQKKEEERRRLAASIVEGAGRKFEAAPDETHEEKDIRSSKEYLEAWVRDAKKGTDTECRALLTVNASGVVPVPTYVEGKIRTAWERLEIMRRVRKVSYKGNLSVGFEVSSTPAAVHDEGDTAPDEETLVLGSVTILAKSIKKYIRISDEAMDLTGEDFADYIVDELTYRISKAAQEALIGLIATLPDTVSTTSVSADAVPALRT